MTTSLRKLLALGAFFVLVVAVAAGCGGGVPSNGVARVGDTVVTKSEFNKTLDQLLNSSAAAAGAQKPVAPDPPDYTKCVASLKKTAPKPAKGQPKTTDAQFKVQCKQQYENARNQALQTLISNQWILGEAKDLGVSISDKQVETEMNKQIKAFFKKPGQFEKYLKTSGLTREDLLKQFRVQQLTQKIRDKVTKDVKPVTAAAVSAYFAKNKAQFSQPERRNLLVVLTKTQAQADKAKAALDSGTSFASVAKQYSIDPSTKTQGGALNGVTKGQQEKQFDDAIFKAKRNVIVGPIKTQFGYYVFKVTSTTPASKQSFASVKNTIRQQLVQQGQNDVLSKFAKKFQDDWQKKTDCAKDYVIPQCKNAPKQKTETGPTGSGGAQ